eukprot:217448-Pyramimonas_sp.AAC.1
MGLDGMQILLEVQKISQEINEEWDRIIGGLVSIIDSELMIMFASSCSRQDVSVGRKLPIVVESLLVIIKL